MTTFFPLLAVVLAVFAFVISGPKERRPSTVSLQVSAFAVYVIAALVTFEQRPIGESMAIIEGYGLGLFGAMAASLYSTRAATLVGSMVSAFAFGVAAAGSVHLLRSGHAEMAQLGALVGCGLTAVILDIQEDSLASVAALAVAATVSPDLLGLLATKSHAPGYAGTMIGLAAAALGLAAVAVDRFGKVGTKSLIPLVLVALLSAMGWFLARQWPDLHEAVKLMPIAGAAGIAVHWMMPANGESSNLRLGLAIIIWCSLATFAFGVLKSFGVALALAGASFTLLILANPRALASLASLMVLTLYRVFRSEHPDTYQAIDLGQHYALVGLILGAMAATLPLEWLRNHPERAGRKASLGMVIWALYLLGAPAIVGVMLSERGMIGFLVGLGMAPLIAGWQDRRSLGVLSLSAGLGGLTLLVFSWLSDFLDVARDEKVRFFGYSVVGIVIGGIVLSMLGAIKAQEAVS